MYQHHSDRSHPQLRGPSPRAGRRELTVTDLRVLSILTDVPAPLRPQPPQPRGPSPRAGCRIRIVTDLPVLSSLTDVPAPLARQLPPVAGTVPASGLQSTDCYGSSGSIGVDGCASTTQAAATPSCGDRPRQGAWRDDYYRSLGFSVLPDIRIVPDPVRLAFHRHRWRWLVNASGQPVALFAESGSGGVDPAKQWQQ
jgi:hypothetical protein